MADDVRGYLPPEGPQTVHKIDHTYRENQSVHKIGQTAIQSPEAVILTADEAAQKRIERFNIERIPDDVAREALEAYLEDDTETIESILEAWREGEEIGEEIADSDDSADTKPSIPPDDELEDMEYRDIQALAGEYDLPGNQSKEEFVVSLQEIRDESNE